MRVRIRATLALAVLALGFAVIAPASPAQAYPPTTCATLSVSTTHPAPGAKITVTGSNFLANTKVKLVLHSKTYFLVAVTTDANGDFSVQVQLPAGVSPGHHRIIAKGGANGVKNCPADPFQTLSIQGSAQSPTPTSTGSSGPTAFTGVDIAALLGAAALLVAAGVLFARSGRRRSSHT
jgi:hypothetical protein